MFALLKKKWILCALLMLLCAFWVQTSVGCAEALPKLQLTPAAKTITLTSGTTAQRFSIAFNSADFRGKSAKVKWSSSNAKIAKVNQSGLVTPLKSGKVSIRCAITQGGKTISAQSKLTITTLKPTGVALSISKTRVTVGGSATLKPTIAPSNAYNKTVQYRSGNTAIATVSAKGVIKTKKAGKVRLFVKTKSGGKESYVDLLVSPDLAKGKVRAYVVGQANYQGDARNQLPGCRKDAQMIASAFKNANYSGKSASVSLYYDLKGDQLKSLLRDLPKQGITEKDTTVFYFSGHGVGSGAMAGALCGIDWKVVSVADVRTFLDKVPGKVVVMLDSCLSGQFIQSKSNTNIIGSNGADSGFCESFIAEFERAYSGKSLTASAKRAKYKILTASAPRQECYTSNDRFDGCSVFTDYLAQGLGEDYAMGKVGMRADGSADGIVTMAELYAYVDARVKAYVARNKSYVQTTMVWPSGDKTPIIARLPK